MAQPQVARWEKSRYRTVPLDRMRKVADALGIDLHAVRRVPADRAAESRAAYAVAPAGVDPLAVDALRRTGADVEALLDTERALRGLLHRNVDLVERRLLEGSENHIRRRHILDSARPVWAEREPRARSG